MEAFEFKKKGRHGTSGVLPAKEKNFRTTRVFREVEKGKNKRTEPERRTLRRLLSPLST